MIGFAMSEKRIDRRPDLFALPHHDIHRIMQKCVPDLRAGLGHKDVRLRLTSHQHWQRTDVIEVRMRNQNGIDLAIGDRPKVGQSILALLLGMHAAIEDNSLLPRFEIVTVGADLGPTRQVNELQEERQLARSLPRDQTTNSPLRRCPRAVMVLTISSLSSPNVSTKGTQILARSTPRPY